MRTGIITEKEVTEAISVRDAYQLVVQAHQALSRGDAMNIVRSRARSGEMSLHTMSALDRSQNYAATKVYSSVGPMISSHVLLYRVSNGELLSMIESKELGRLRTAATVTAAMKALAPGPLKTIGIIGAGYQAEGLVHSFQEFREDIGFERLLVTSRTSSRAQRLCEAMAKRYDLQIETRETTKEVCEESDGLATATTATNPIIDVEWLENTRVICALGSNSLIRRELGTKVINEAKVVVVDDHDVARAEGGNLLPSIESGKLNWRSVWELGAVLCGRKMPQLEKGWVVFCSHGLALQDLALARAVYESHSARGRSPNSPKD